MEYVLTNNILGRFLDSVSGYVFVFMVYFSCDERYYGPSHLILRPPNLNIHHGIKSRKVDCLI